MVPMECSSRCKWMAVLLGLCALLWSSGAWAQTLSFSLRFPGGIKYRSSFVRLVKKQIRLALVQSGFGVAGGVTRNGFHMRIRVSVEEELSADSAASCNIQFQGQVIMMPQRRMVINSFSSSGSGKFSRAAKLDRAKIRRLRTLAARQVSRYLGRNMRNMIRQIQAKMRTLKKGQVLGKKIRFGGGGGGGGKGKAAAGKPLPGRPPVLKMIPAGIDRKNSRPPIAADK